MAAASALEAVVIVDRNRRIPIDISVGHTCLYGISALAFSTSPGLAHDENAWARSAPARDDPISPTPLRCRTRIVGHECNADSKSVRFVPT